MKGGFRLPKSFFIFAAGSAANRAASAQIPANSLNAVQTADAAAEIESNRQPRVRERSPRLDRALPASGVEAAMQALSLSPAADASPQIGRAHV